MASSKDTRFLRAAGLCGVVAPTLSWILIFSAVAVSPWFNWHTDALSDLGVYPRAGALLFNGALIAGGALTIVLVLGIGQWIGPGWLGRLGTMVALVGAVALGLVGVFPENYRALHWTVAATYFLITPVGYTLLGAEIWRQGRRAHGASAIAAGVGAFVAIAFIPHDGLAVPELVAALLLTSRAFYMGMNLILESER